MRRLADERQPARDVALRQHQPERIGPARPDRLDRAEKVAEARRELGRERGIGERHQPRRELGAFRPHDRGAVAGHRQDRERARRQKMLDRDAAMRTLVAHRRHDSGLAIAPLDGADACRAAQRRPLPVGRRDQAGPDPSSVGELGDCGKGRSLDRPDGERSEEGEARKRPGTFDQCAAQHPVFDDIAERVPVPSSRWS